MARKDGTHRLVLTSRHSANRDGYNPPGGFASNGYGELSPGKYGIASCFLIEVIATFFFLYVIIGTTSKGAAVGFAGIPIGLCLTLIHLFLIPVTNASVNPARSTGPALFAGGAYIGQLWLFWLAPILVCTEN
jgi:aquaporin Z